MAEKARRVDIPSMSTYEEEMASLKAIADRAEVETTERVDAAVAKAIADWRKAEMERRRYEIARDVLAAFIAAGPRAYSPDGAVAAAIGVADGLLAELERTRK